MKLHAMLALWLISTLRAADPAWLSTGEFQWKSSPPLIGPAADTADPDVALKDPTIVFHEEKWHLFATHRRASGKVDMQYLSFTDWNEAGKATRHTLDLHNQYHCAPQVFFFTPHQKWYLIYQLADERRGLKMAPYYSTTSTIADPKSWTKPQPMIETLPEGGDKVRWIDFWVICDAAKAHLFYTSDDGHFWRRETTLSHFPLGWSKPELLLKDTKEELFEASHTYKLKGREQYLTLIEAMAPGQRYYKAWIADKLEGPWKPLAATRDHPFASTANVTQTEPWTTSISHGELIRSSNNETLEVDPANLRFVFQGVDAEGYQAKKYGSIPWRIGILDLQTSYLEQALNRFIFPQISFQGADVEEAMTYLHVKSREVQIASGGKAGGVNSIIRVDEKTSSSKISLNAENISYRDALEEIARQSGLRLTLFRQGVLLEPKSEQKPVNPWQQRDKKPYATLADCGFAEGRCLFHDGLQLCWEIASGLSLSFRTCSRFRMIEECIQVDLFAHRGFDGSSGTGDTSCAGNDRAVGLSWHTGFVMFENTRHLADMQGFFDLSRGHRGACLCQGDKGQQSGKHEFRFHDRWLDLNIIQKTTPRWLTHEALLKFDSDAT